MMMDKKTKRRY